MLDWVSSYLFIYFVIFFISLTQRSSESLEKKDTESVQNCLFSLLLIIFGLIVYLTLTKFGILDPIFFTLSPLLSSVISSLGVSLSLFLSFSISVSVSLFLSLSLSLYILSLSVSVPFILYL